MATLEQLLTPRWGPFIKNLARALDRHGIEFAVIGGMALGKRAQRVRSTEDIDILVGETAKRKLDDAMLDAGLIKVEGAWPLVKYSDGILEVDVMCGVGDPEESALELAETLELFEHPVKIATRVFLVWLYLTSNVDQHEVDAKNVLRAMKLKELQQLRAHLRWDRDTDAEKKLARWLKEIG